MKPHILDIPVFILALAMIFTGCASIPLIKPLPPCDPSRFDMKTYRGKAAHYWCEVKQDAKKL